MYDGASPNPYIFLDGDISTNLRAFAAHPLLRISESRSPKKGDVRSDNAIVADGDIGRVKDGTVPPYHHVVTNRNVISVIASERSLDYYFLSDTTGSGNGGDYLG